MTDRLPHEKGFHVSWDQIHRDARALRKLGDRALEVERVAHRRAHQAKMRLREREKRNLPRDAAILI